MTALMTTKDVKRVSEQEVRAVLEPEFTRSWHPISHAKVLDALDIAVTGTGIAVINRDYSLNQNGLNLFGTMMLDQGTNDRPWLLGFRNSMQKSYAVGFCAGLEITVCSNMIFKGEFLEFRKHTARLDFNELTEIAHRTLGGILPQIEALAQWQDNLHQYPLRSAHRKILTYNSMASGVFSPGKFNEFNTCYDMEKEISESGETVYTFHGAATRLMKDNSLFQVNTQNAALERVVNGYIQTIDSQNRGD